MAATLEPGEIEVIMDAAAEAGTRYRDDYSGRAMFGSKCIGITGSMQAITATVARVAMADPGLARRMIGRMRTDNMGLDMIAYWPGMEASE